MAVLKVKDQGNILNLFTEENCIVTWHKVWLQGKMKNWEQYCNSLWLVSATLPQHMETITPLSSVIYCCWWHTCYSLIISATWVLSPFSPWWFLRFSLYHLIFCRLANVTLINISKYGFILFILLSTQGIFPTKQYFFSTLKNCQ